MTYRELIEHLSHFPPDQMDQNVTIYIPGDEYITVCSMSVVDLDIVNDDVLYEGHIVLNAEGV
tara:strand:- start:358 stop:546 length:189 start_codon:yes stop_codon:yes gene_type:complete